MPQLILTTGLVLGMLSPAAAAAAEPKDAATLPVELHELWKLKTDGPVHASPVVVDGVVYFGSGDKYVYAVEKATGKVKWRIRTGRPVDSTPAVAGGMVYIVSGDGRVYAADAATGEFKWIFRTKGEMVLDPWDYFQSSPVVSEGVVYFGSGDGHVYAVDAKTGKQVWAFATGGVVHATPALADGRVYIGSFDGFFYALDAKTGALVWKFKTVGDTWFPTGEVQGSATVANGVVYFGSRDFNIYALDAATGAGRWNYKVLNSWVISQPNVVSDTVYFGTSDAYKTFALDANTGEIKWTHDVPANTFGGSVAVGNTLYFGNMIGKLYGLDLKTGADRAFFQTAASKSAFAKVVDAQEKLRPEVAELYMTDYWRFFDTFMEMGAILGTPCVDGDVIFFGGADGYMYAVQLPKA